MGMQPRQLFIPEVILTPKNQFKEYFVLGTGVEPARSCEHMDLNHARLPIPPPEQIWLK